MPGLPHPGWKRRGDRPVPPGRGILPGGEPAGSEPAGLPAGGCGGASAEDAKYFLGVTQEAGPCTVHTAAQPDPDLPFDPNQPWDPSDPWNPNTNPLDPTGQGGGVPPTLTGGPGRASGRRDGGPQRDGPHHQPGDREALRILNKNGPAGHSSAGPFFVLQTERLPYAEDTWEPLVISIFYLEKDLSGDLFQTVDPCT